MKKVIILALAASVFGLNMAQAQKKNLKIKGSDTCLPLIQEESAQYMKKDNTTSLTVTGGGSGVGISSLMSGTTDVAMASRKMKMDEKLKMNEAGKAFVEKEFAKDALAVVVNPANKVSQLTREQLEGIFTGKIKNWKDVGGEDLAIVVYSRETSSGTYEFFKEHVLSNKNFASTALLMPATGAIVQSISQTKGAIGYVGLAYVEKDVKALAVSYDKGKKYVTPSVENAKNGSYPVTRPLFLYYLKKDEARVNPFLTYILSADGQKIVKEVGYVPL